GPPGAGAPAREGGDRGRGGHEHALQRVVVAAGPAEPAHAPGVVDAGALRRHEDQPRRRTRAVWSSPARRDDAVGEQPGGVAPAARERPAAGHAVTALDRLRDPARLEL